jgi:hypothetical protein
MHGACGAPQLFQTLEKGVIRYKNKEICCSLLWRRPQMRRTVTLMAQKCGQVVATCNLGERSGLGHP